MRPYILSNKGVLVEFWAAAGCCSPQFDSNWMMRSLGPQTEL